MVAKTKSYNNHNKRKKNKKNVEYNKNKNIINNSDNNNNNNNDNNNNYKCIKISNYNIKVGEHEFCLTSESLNHDAPNFFTAAFFGYFSEAKTTNIFIERDPTYFGMIVRYLRGYQVNWPINDKVTMNNLISDAKFYSFEKLINLLEELYDKSFPEKVMPWKILTYAPENNPVVVINIKDVELSRWNSRSLVYDTNPISKNEKNGDDNNDGNDNDNDGNDNDVDSNVDNVDDADGNSDDARTDNANDNRTDNAAADNDDNVVDNNDNDNDDNDNAANNDDDLEGPNAEKGLHRLEIHGRDALATVTSNHNNGIKFENFTLKNSVEEETFRVLTESFRTSDGSLTLSPSLKLPYLKDSCIEIDGSKYYTYKDLSDYFGVTSRGKQLYFEEIVLRIVDGAFLMKARAFTIPYYYASQPHI